MFKKVFRAVFHFFSFLFLALLCLEFFAFLYLKIYPGSQIDLIKPGWVSTQKPFDITRYPFLLEKRVWARWPKSELIASKDKQNVDPITIHTDSLGRRYSHVPGSMAPPVSEHLLFFGDSIVWGEGLVDEQTLPWIINSKQKQFFAWNLSFPGASAADLLLRVDEHGAFNDILPNKGAALYIFTANHINRFFGSLMSLEASGDHLAFYKEIKPSEFKFKGTQRAARPFRTLLFSSLAKLHFIKLFKINFPWLRKSDYAQYARLVHVLKQKYQQKFGVDNRFFVVLYPDDGSEVDYPELVQALKENSMEVIDYSNLLLWHFYEGPPSTPNGYPTHEAHEFFADILLYDLRAILMRRD